MDHQPSVTTNANGRPSNHSTMKDLRQHGSRAAAQWLGIWGSFVTGGEGRVSPLDCRNFIVKEAAGRHVLGGQTLWRALHADDVETLLAKSVEQPSISEVGQGALQRCMLILMVYDHTQKCRARASPQVHDVSEWHWRICNRNAYQPPNDLWTNPGVDLVAGQTVQRLRSGFKQLAFDLLSQQWRLILVAHEEGMERRVVGGRRGGFTQYSLAGPQVSAQALDIVIQGAVDRGWGLRLAMSTMPQKFCVPLWSQSHRVSIPLQLVDVCLRQDASQLGVVLQSKILLLRRILQCNAAEIHLLWAKKLSSYAGGRISTVILREKLHKHQLQSGEIVFNVIMIVIVVQAILLLPQHHIKHDISRNNWNYETRLGYSGQRPYVFYSQLLLGHESKG